MGSKRGGGGEARLVPEDCLAGVGGVKVVAGAARHRAGVARDGVRLAHDLAARQCQLGEAAALEHRLELLPLVARHAAAHAVVLPAVLAERGEHRHAHPVALPHAVEVEQLGLGGVAVGPRRRAGDNVGGQRPQPPGRGAVLGRHGAGVAGLAGHCRLLPCARLAGRQGRVCRGDPPREREVQW